MTRQEAEALCADNSEGHPERATHRWMAREREDGEWTVVKLRLPEGMRASRPLKATVEAKPKPPEPDDPRPAYWRNVGGPWVG
jgi:hypothetical protein